MFDEQLSAQVGAEILRQLGANKFLAMTGAKNLTVACERFDLRMDLPRNSGNVNRLEIKLLPDDTYKMRFYKKMMKNYVDLVIKNESVYEGVYCDQLQEIFTSVTGMDTHL